MDVMIATRWIVRASGLCVAALAALAGVSRAESPSVFQRLMVEVEASWESGYGRSAEVAVQAAERAESRVAGPWEALIFEVSPEVSPGPSMRAEVAIAAGAELRIAGTGFLGREAASLRLLARAEQAASRADFGRGAIERYGAWLSAALQASHFSDHLVELEEVISPLREAARQRLVPELVVDGLEVELVRLAMAREAARSEAEVAAAGLAAYLGRDVSPETWGALPRTGLAARWGELLDLRSHPELTRLRAEEASDNAMAETAGRVDDVRLTVAATLRQVAEPEGSKTYGGVGVLFKVPLARSGAAEAERLRGEGMAKRFSREARENRFVFEVRQRERRHLAWERELDFLRTVVAPRLTQRVDKIASAAAMGRASAEALVLARRDLIELHHDEVRLIGLLAVSALESEAFALALGRPQKSQGDRP